MTRGGCSTVQEAAAQKVLGIRNQQTRGSTRCGVADKEEKEENAGKEEKNEVKREKEESQGGLKFLLLC